MKRFVAVIACLVVAGCAHSEPPTSEPKKSFEYLYERNLSEFELEVATAEHVGDRGPWTRVGRAWLDLVNCEGIERRFDDPKAEDGPVEDDLARLMETTLLLELRRQSALALDDAPLDADHYFARWGDSDFFDRRALATDDEVIRWPSEAERWSDEGPAPIAVDERCDTLDERLLEAAVEEAQQRAEEAADGEDVEADDVEQPTVAQVRRRFERAQLDAVERVVERVEALAGDEVTGHVALLDFRTRLYGAHLHLRFAQRDEEGKDDHLERGLALLEGQAEVDQAPAEESASMHFLRARLASDLGEPSRAVADVEMALEAGLERDDAYAARYLALSLHTDAGRFEEALAIARGLPDADAPIFAPYAYKKALAARQLDAEDRFMRVVMEALSSASDSSPFVEALYRDALEVISEYPFDEQTVELVEEMGPPGGLYPRLADLGGVALERGRPDRAEQIANWLLERHEHPDYRPRYRAMLATAAFLQDDEETFRRQVRAMTRRRDSVDEALDDRAADFYEDADRTFGRLMSQMLPTMAEWDESVAQRRRRQRWLGIAVDEVQRFLRAVDHTRVESDLVELYRLASTLLEEHPRGYASRVGQEEATPLVLGTVRVGRSELIDEEPQVAPELETPDLLTLVPRPGQPADQWTFGFAEREGDDD